MMVTLTVMTGQMKPIVVSWACLNIQQILEYAAFDSTSTKYLQKVELV